MQSVRWGIIGTGQIVRKAVAPAILRLDCAVLGAVASRDEGRAESLARETGAKRWHRTWQDLIQEDGIDAVYVATPHHLHAEQAIAAARAGKHVLCEKPMSLNGAQCRDVIRACAEHGVKLGVAYYRRFYPLLRRVNDILAQGGIGTASLCQINSFTCPGKKAVDVERQLLERHHIHVDDHVRDGHDAVRVSTHFYNTRTEIDRLIEALRGIV